MKIRHGVTVIIGFATMILLMALFERSLIFFPTRYPDGLWDTEAAARGSGCAIDDHFFTASDGVRLHGWWCRQTGARADQPMLLFFHGNAGNLSHRAELLIELATRTPASVFVVGYRGYGRSEGQPSENGLYLDARAAWKHLTDAMGIGADRVIIFGKSLGGGVAVDLAMEAPAAGLIVESSFTSIPDMAGAHYPFVPKFLVRTQMNSAVKIPYVSMPKLFIHSREDRVVPYRLGRELYEAAPEPKRFHEVVGAGHNETWLVGGTAYFQALSEFVGEASAGPKEEE
jgi:fermentation-respiration switch protein FrsA (DUF1100 family)